MAAVGLGCLQAQRGLLDGITVDTSSFESQLFDIPVQPEILRSK